MMMVLVILWIMLPFLADLAKEKGHDLLGGALSWLWLLTLGACLLFGGMRYCESRGRWPGQSLPTD